jgi:uncharacterized protein YggT (Ycf19 family)
MIRLILKIGYIIDTLIETLLTVRILLSIFASNSSHTFIEWVYTTSDIFISPFKDIFPSVLVIDNIEISVTPVIALVFYAIIAFVLSELIKTFRKE